MTMTSDIQLLRREVLGRGHATLERVTVRRKRFDGRRQDVTRDVYTRGDAATILLYDLARGTVVLVRQFRPGAFVGHGEPDLLEAPAGKLEGADALTRMLMEVEEEAGFRIATARKVFEAYMSPACLTERITFFVAPYTPADRVSAGGGLEDEGEDIEVVEPTLGEALAMVETGRIIDVKTIALLHYAVSTRLMTA
jgi:nudix-type nucleoside diphosphatase (YffH/AdpP family)